MSNQKARPIEISISFPSQIHQAGWFWCLVSTTMYHSTCTQESAPIYTNQELAPIYTNS